MKFSLGLILSVTILTIVLGSDLLTTRLPKFTIIKDKAITDRYEKIAHEWYKKETAKNKENFLQDIELKYHSTAKGFSPDIKHKVIRVMFNMIHKKKEGFHHAGLIMLENGTVLGPWKIVHGMFWNQVPDEVEADRYLKLALDAYKRETKTKTKNLEHKVIEITEIYAGKHRIIKVVIDVTNKDSMEEQQAGFMLYPNGTVGEHMIPMEYQISQK